MALALVMTSLKSREIGGSGTAIGRHAERSESASSILLDNGQGLVYSVSLVCIAFVTRLTQRFVAVA